VTCFLSPLGLRCIVETDKSAQLQSYLSKDLFQSYQFPSTNTSDSFENDSEQELEEIEFSLDLSILLDCLSLFDDTGSGSWKDRDGTAESGSYSSSMSAQGSLVMQYTKHGEDLVLK
jgi:hypothetical protein